MKTGIMCLGRKWAAIAFCGVAVAAAATATPAPAPQKGRVLDENEKPIVGASVYIAGRVKGPLPHERKVLAEATSDADGNFGIPALRDGYDDSLEAFAHKAGLAWGMSVFHTDKWEISDDAVS